ncbi:MAG: NADH:ubiquinone oxidoreductase subunit J [Methanoregula sp. PtaU1.Bin051]|nr:MAG: NADH:ubiquinone oxidoreductase subunit J [Methanoregula sp. PtaU1.Bin051]
MPEYEVLVIAAVAFSSVALAAVAIVHKNLIRSVAAYAGSSICLAGLFFFLASPYAGALELTVGAGLVAVLFLVALILAGGEESEVPS